MHFALLKEAIETYVLFGMAPVYFVLLSVVQNRYLKQLKRIENKYIKAEVKQEALKTIKKLKRRGPLLLLIGSGLHAIAYLLLSGTDFRSGYFISIGIFYLIFLAVMFINFLLRGASILKDTGDFGGLPG